MTFDPHPAKVVAPERAPRLLSTTSERVHYMAGGHRAGPDTALHPGAVAAGAGTVHRSDPADRLHSKAVLIGDNFRFGVRHSGDVHTLQELGPRYGFFTEVVHAIELRGRVVSAVKRGGSWMPEKSPAPHACSAALTPSRGTLFPGTGWVRKQTVPTLNLSTAAEILPRTGVYITSTHDLDADRRWDSVTNVGIGRHSAGTRGSPSKHTC